MSLPGLDPAASDEAPDALAPVLRAFFTSAPAGLAVWDRDLRCVQVNDAFARITGQAAEDHVGLGLREALPQLPEETVPRLRRALASGRPLADVEVTGAQNGATGGPPTWLARFFGVQAADGRLLGAGTVATDVTERLRLEAALAHEAGHDALTGLPNRALFLDRLTRAHSRARRSGRFAAVLFVDLDAFKRVNDDMGHAAGDELLVLLGSRLCDAVRPEDTVARLGGDEFGVLCEDLTAEQDAVAVAGRILDGMIAPLALRERTVLAGASVGIALTTGREADHGDVLRNADAAMYRAKERGGRRYELFDDALRARVSDRLELEAALKLAVERQELALALQPQVSLRERRIVGAEALLRWPSPPNGPLGPSEFIPVAEAIGVIHELGLWVIDRACAFAARCSSAADALRVAVNLSPSQLERPELVDAVATILDRHRLAPRRLCLEVTETVLLHRTETNAMTLAALRALGVGIALDDFGTGYSSLAFLRHFPIDAIKLDRSFVAGLGTEEDGHEANERIVSFVLAFARGQGIDAVAEGVETDAQAQRLLHLGYETAQGFRFGRPEPADALAGRLT